MSLFFERLQCLCREYKSSPNAVAAKLGLSSGSITAWKRGTLPRGETMQKLADFFHVSVDYLLGNVSEPYFYLDNERILRELNSYEGGEEIVKAPTPDGERKSSDPVFTYAMSGEVDKLTPERKEMLRGMAQYLIDQQAKEEQEKGRK